MLRLQWDSGTHDLRDSGAMLYQLSYEASLEALILSLSIHIKKKEVQERL